MAVLATSPFAFAHQNPGATDDCDLLLVGAKPAKIDVLGQLDQLTLTSALVLRHTGLPANQVTEIIRMELLDGDGRMLEVAIYSGSESDGQAARQRLRHFSRTSSLAPMLDPKQIVFIGRETLLHVAMFMAKNYPHVADLISRFGAFGRARYIDTRFTHLDYSPRMLSREAYQRILTQFERFQDYVRRRKFTSDGYQVLISKDGDFQFINPESLQRGTREEVEEALAKFRKRLEAIRP